MSSGVGLRTEQYYFLIFYPCSSVFIRGSKELDTSPR
jgi:hypothetical protein